MVDSPLTKEFEFVSFPKLHEEVKKSVLDDPDKIVKKLKFPKPVKEKKVRNYRDMGFNNPTMANKRKLARKAHKTLKKRLPSISSLKRKADNVFSKWIRERDNNICVLKSEKCILTIQAGHLIKRGKMNTRYDEENVHALCMYHNYLDFHEPQHYIAWFVKKYGSDKYLELVERSKQIRQFKRGNFIYIIARYENKT